MTISQDIFDLRVGGTYLPSLVLLLLEPNIDSIDIWIFPFMGISLIHLIALVALVGAVNMHGLLRNIFGIGGPEENPLKKSQALEGEFYAFAGRFPTAEEYNTNYIFHLFRPSKVGLETVVHIWIFVISLISWAIALFTSLYFGGVYFDQVAISAQLLLFAEMIWIAQWLFWRGFSPYYLE